MSDTPRTDEAFTSCCTMTLLACSRELEAENTTLKARIAELESDRRIAAVLERIAKAHGIADPHQLIGMAENDEENYAEILARHVETQMKGDRA